MKAAANDKN